jgi:hypothetical protein
VTRKVSVEDYESALAAWRVAETRARRAEEALAVVHRRAEDLVSHPCADCPAYREMSEGERA